MVNRLTILPQKILQLEAFPIEESPFDSDVIPRPKRAETINIRSPSIVGKRNDDPFSGLTADFEGAALEIHLFHSAIHRVEVSPRL